MIENHNYLHVSILDLDNARLKLFFEKLGVPEYRVKQVLDWVYKRFAASFEDMTELPLSFRRRLGAEARLRCLSPLREVVSRDGTVKVLFSLADGSTIESAMMPYPAAGGQRRCTLCLSTQVGCAVGCPFCATGQQRFERNLTPGEIIDQVLYFANRLKTRDNVEAGGAEQSAVTNIVFMGMGEPLANYDSLLQVIEMLTSPDAFGLGARNIVVSTSGLVPRIDQLARKKLQIGLAVSLHASTNTLRDKLVPVNRKYPLQQLIPACQHYFEATGRRVSFEYALFDGINDSLPQSRSLARLLRGLNCHVNLIAANITGDRVFKAPGNKTVLAFEEELKRLRIACTLRQPKGLDIDAGCGQLRSRFLQESGHPAPINLKKRPTSGGNHGPRQNS